MARVEAGVGHLQESLVVPPLEAGVPMETTRIPSVASDNLLCACGSMMPPPRCWTELILMPGGSTRGTVWMEGSSGCGALASSCPGQLLMPPSQVTLGQSVSSALIS